MAIVPAASILFLALIALLPWGGGDVARFAAAMMPMFAIRFWSLRRPATVPAALAFVTGLLLDVVSYGPLGFWALIALAALALARIEGSFHHASLPSVTIGWLAATAIALAALAWIVSSIYFNRPVPWQPTLIGAALSALLSPVLGFLLDPLDRLWGVPRGGLFTRER